MRELVSLALCVTFVACGPQDRTSPAAGEEPGVDGGGDDGAGDEASAVEVRGTVWAPGNAPGMVPPGHEIPVAGAMVYASLAQPAAPAEGEVTCTPCTEAPPSAVITDAKGNFSLRVAPGTSWLVIQKAQFRIDQQVYFSDQTGTLPPELTTLPSVSDPLNGRWIPRIALVVGYSGDPMESILGKLGIGQVDPTGVFLPASAAGKFDLYANSRDIVGNSPNVRALVTDLERMMQYDIIFFPCSTSDDSTLLDQVDVRRNIRDYVAAGGRLYVADWAGDWVDNVFPAEIELAGSYDTPATAYDRASDTWYPARFGSANGSPSYTSVASVAEPGLAEWLEGQMDASGPISAGAISVVGNWNRIAGLTDVEIGQDDMGQPVLDAPRTYVTGTAPGWDAQVKPLMATYEPAGCGRVMYSTFHTTSYAHVGLLPQERVLVYLLLEIGVCKDDPVVE